MSDLLKAAQLVVDLSLKLYFLNLEYMLLTTSILPMRNGQSSQSITSSYLSEFPLSVK